jgi:hypothetical protein
MLIKNLVTLQKGVWLGTDSELKTIIVWNLSLNTKESWALETSECFIEEDPPLLLERENDFFKVLEAITSPQGMEVIDENELMSMVIKSIKYFFDAGCLGNSKTLQDSIETVQEVMYCAIGDQPCGGKRDELILFIHQKIPSILQGAYWGYSLSKLSGSQQEEETETDDLPQTTETEEPKKVVVSVSSSAPYYGCCSRFCFRRTIYRTM